MRAALPGNETERLQALHDYDILDTDAEESFDAIARLAAYIAGVPTALISFIDRDRQWFKSRVNFDAHETDRDVSFCAHAILMPDRPMVVRDATKDARFADNPGVLGDPHVRFYFGAPLVTGNGHALGTLCVVDQEPRELTVEQHLLLTSLSDLVMDQLDARAQAKALQRAAADREVYLSQLETYQQELEAANRQLHRKSMTDKLTGVGNRAAFDQRLTEDVYRFHRYGSPLSLLLIDVDHFKAYNDSYGHPAGDAALQQVAEVLRECRRPSDFVARYGGEEFALILPATGAEGATVLAERVRRALEAAKYPNRSITASVGAASLDTEGSAEQLIHQADKALYAAKAAGRNRALHFGAMDS